jgi:hypothetical protein
VRRLLGIALLGRFALQQPVDAGQRDPFGQRQRAGLRHLELPLRARGEAARDGGFEGAVLGREVDLAGEGDPVLVPAAGRVLDLDPGDESDRLAFVGGELHRAADAAVLARREGQLAFAGEADRFPVGPFEHGDVGRLDLDRGRPVGFDRALDRHFAVAALGRAGETVEGEDSFQRHVFEARLPPREAPAGGQRQHFEAAVEFDPRPQRPPAFVGEVGAPVAGGPKVDVQLRGQQFGPARGSLQVAAAQPQPVRVERPFDIAEGRAEGGERPAVEVDRRVFVTAPVPGDGRPAERELAPVFELDRRPVAATLDGVPERAERDVIVRGASRYRACVRSARDRPRTAGKEPPRSHSHERRRPARPDPRRPLTHVVLHATGAPPGSMGR